MAYFSDFETTTDKISTKWSRVYIWGLKEDVPNAEMLWGLDIKDWFETVKEQDISEIYFHNLSFDGNYIFKWLLKNDIKFVDSKKKLRSEENAWTWVCDDQGNIYTMDIIYKGHHFSLLDSWKVLMASVADLGKSIGKNKLEIDYDEYTIFQKKEDVPQKVIEYLERDIDVVIETFQKAINLYKKAITRASMALNDFIDDYGNWQYVHDFGGKTWLYEEGRFGIKNVLSKEDWLLINRSYFGGWTNWNKELTDIKVEIEYDLARRLYGVSYDINSSYPGAMKDNLYPYGPMLKSKPKGDYLELLVVMIYKAEPKDPRYPGIFKGKGKNEDNWETHIANEERVIWAEEFDFMRKYYSIDYKILKRCYFKAKMVFQEWITKKQWLKINAVEKVEQDFHKGIYNSGYGKFGQNIFLGSRLIVEDDTPTHLRHKSQLRYGSHGQFIHTAVVSETELRKHVAVASRTTSLGRLNIWKAVFENIDLWLYSDTDSCYFRAEPKGLWIDPSAFGAWKSETRFSAIKILRAKCYMVQAEEEWSKKLNDWEPSKKLIKKISGVSKEGKDQINWDNFHIGSVIKNAKRGSKNVEDGKLILLSDYQLGVAPELQ